MSNSPAHNPRARQLSPKGIMIAVGLPIVLVGAMVATILGTGAFSRAPSGDGSSLWLWTVPTGEIARVNGLTAATDARVEIADAAGNPVQIEQNDRYLLLRDITTGQVTTIDLRTLAVASTAETEPGEGVRLALHEDRAFIVNRLQGQVTQVDPADLSPVGPTLTFPAGLTGGDFDSDGKLWLGVPREGTLVSVEPSDEGASATRTETVAAPGQDLSLTVLGDGVAVLNRTAQKVTTLRPGGKLTEADVELAGPTEAAETSPGHVATVTVTDPPSVVAVEDESAKHFSITAQTSPLLGASVEFGGRIYVPDGGADKVWVYGLDGTELSAIDIEAGGGPIEMYAAGEVLFANAVYTNKAVVVSADGSARIAPKNRDDILGGNVPPIEVDENGEGEGDDDTAGPAESGGDEDAGDREPQRPEEPVEPEEPDPEPPGAVTGLTGVVADRAATLSWGAAPNNGAALTKYVVEGAERSWDVAPGQRVLDVDGLVNGEIYTFTVTAHNAEGAGPPTVSEPLRPTAEVPDPVAAVEAVEHPDGTVTLAWDEPDGQGLEITGYQVEQVASDGSREVVAETAEPGYGFAAGDLVNGRSYAFSVTTLAGDAAAEPSPNSATVVPFQAPAAPRSLKVTTPVDRAGTLVVSWLQPSTNGRDISEYRVTYGGSSRTVTGTEVTLTGLGDGESVGVSVVAVNEAGPGRASSVTGKTMSVPTITDFRLIEETKDGGVTVYISIDDGDGTTRCQLKRDGANYYRGACGGYTGAENVRDTDYRFELIVTNAAGKDTATTRIDWF